MRKLSLFCLFLVSVMLVVGCTPKTPKDVLQEAYIKSADIKTSSFDIGIELELDSKSDAIDEETAMVLSLLQDAKISAKGKYDAVQERLEMKLGLELTGDMKMSLDIPMIVEGETLLVKVPSIPFLPLPAELVGKYIKVDMAELKEQGLVEESEADIELVKAMATEILGVFIDDFGSGKFVTELKKEEIPAGIEGQHVIQVKVTDETLEEAVTTLVETTLPKLLTILENEKYLSVLNMQKSDIDELRNEMSSGPTAEDYAELREAVTINELAYTLAISKDSYITHQKVSMDIFVKEMETNMKVGIYTNTSDINKELVFDLEKPADDEVILLSELEQYLYAY